MPTSADVQTLSPGGVVELFELDASELGAGMFHFHGYSTEQSIWWRGVEYSPWPVAGDGFLITGEGQQATPTLSVGDVNNTISALCVLYEDLAGAVITRRRTLAKYLDARNFPDGNPLANPDESLSVDIWLVEQKTNEEPGERVDFELASPLDFNDKQLPGRAIIANVCSWRYRGPECGYTGTNYFDQRGNPVDDAARDVCGKCLSDCKKRFGEFNELSFGGFPAADLTRT
ncbi:phage minor tail protein L [Pandoraea commovens]|uniref:Phage minor tail protein L n=1 Tax=Pandoraea commovens TaxID=2508289 RepID=A0ABY5QJZ9_9BURK|nr:phage minor tail protein L [Pandoraea commovens]UVA80473.1 phage minor tail protein L [Pandoraea commovens]